MRSRTNRRDGQGSGVGVPGSGWMSFGESGRDVLVPACGSSASSLRPVSEVFSRDAVGEGAVGGGSACGGAQAASASIRVLSVTVVCRGLAMVQGYRSALLIAVG
jgi:hypothetical protein